MNKSAVLFTLAFVLIVIVACVPAPTPAPTAVPPTAAPKATQAPATTAPAAVAATKAPEATKVAEPTKAAAASPAATGKTVEITFWAALGGDNGKILEAAVNAFNASQTQVKVKYEFQGDYTQTEQKFLTSIAGGQVPDLVMLEISRVPGFANSSALQPLDDFVTGTDGIDTKDFVTALLDESRINGKLYSLPQSRSMPVFYYNRDLLKAAGLEDKAPADWTALREAAIKVTKADGSVTGFGLQIGNPWWYFQSAVESYGADVSRVQGGICTATFNEPKAVQAMQFWYDLVNKDKAAKIYPGEGLTTWEQLQADFISGKVAMMYITTGWMGNIEKNSPFKVGVATLAAGPTGIHKVPTGGNGIVMPAKSPKERQQAAWQFLKWITDTPQTSAWAKNTGYMPLRLSALNDPGLKAYFAERPNFKVAVESMQYASAFPCIKLHPKTETTLNVLWQRIFVAKEPIQKVADETAAQVNALMKEMK